MKYKLIKEYPGSPKLETIYEPKIFDHYEKYKEFWELVVEKNYEILSLKYHNNIYNLAEKDIFKCKTGHIELTTFLANLLPNININSVKRLSDGEIFTVSDNFYPNEYCQSVHSFRTIHTFDLLNDKISINKEASFLSHIIKCKKPLFTTEDGVDIFEGDRFYFLATNWLEMFHNNYGTLTADTNVNAPYAYKRFSTKEKAEEYILYNKPVLSLNDIQNNSNITIGGIKSLTHLVKSKIQQSV